MVKTILAIALVYVLAVIGWNTLGGTITHRTDNQDAALKREVGQLWGTPMEQKAPTAFLAVENQTTTNTGVAAPKGVVIVRGTTTEKHELPIVQNNIVVGLELDQRQKGLLWYSTYRVRYSADYVFENTRDKSGALTVSFAFPAANSLYDEFKFEIDGKPVPFTRRDSSVLVATVPSQAKSRHHLAVNYYSQGLDRFAYRFGDGISEVKNFKLVVTTDFDGYDHPPNTMSPNVPKERSGNGWKLTWDYNDLLSGSGIGIEMPQKLNPGPMAARISFFAPVSLGFFFFLIFVISLLKGVKIHPVNYFFLAAAFFAFHLLLAYMVDHVPLLTAFVVCSVVSIFLVVSYMRAVAGKRFAYLETALAQLTYLVGFSYAFFFEGFTGLAVTIGSIITLFVVMQMTARINWAERFNLNQTNAELETRRS